MLSFAMTVLKGCGVEFGTLLYYTIQDQPLLYMGSNNWAISNRNTSLFILRQKHTFNQMRWHPLIPTQNLTKSNTSPSGMPEAWQRNQVNFWKFASLPAQNNLLPVIQAFSAYFTINVSGPVKDEIFMSPRAITSQVQLPSCWTLFP